MASLGSLDFFDAILGGDSLKSKKPDPEGLLYLLDRFQCSSEQTLLVGDSLVDLEAGKAAGVFTCIVNYGFGDPEEIALAKPDCSIDDLSELKELFY